jgi:hypothetical protein
MNPRTRTLTNAQERTLMWVFLTQDGDTPDVTAPYEKARITLRPATMEALRLCGMLRANGSLTLHGERYVAAVLAEHMASRLDEVPSYNRG